MAAPLAGMVFLLLVILHAFKSFIPTICKWIISFFQTPSVKELKLQYDVKKLKDEQDDIDVKEEFAKHARLQRKINKLTEELKSIRNSKLTTTLTLQGVVTIILHIIHKLSYILLIWQFRTYPVVHLKQEWTWPLGPILAFPSGEPGTIGITWWVIASSLVISKTYHWSQTKKSKKI